MAKKKEQISVPKWLQNELYEKTEPYIDKMIEAYKKEGIEFSRFSLNSIALHSAVVGYYHAVPNPPDEKKEVNGISAIIALAIEFGYKQCEKGENLDAAFINYNKIING